MTTTPKPIHIPVTDKRETVTQPNWGALDSVSPYTIQRPRWTYKYRTTPKPIYIELHTSKPRSIKPESTERSNKSITQTLYYPTEQPSSTPRIRKMTTDQGPPRVTTPKSTTQKPRTQNRIIDQTQTLYYPTKQTTSSSIKPTTTKTTTKTTTELTTRATTTQKNTTQETTTTRARDRTIRIQPGTILMMNSEYLKEKYITPKLAKTFHRALLADYFGLSEKEMKDIGMTVVAWGFSYQVKDKATKSRGRKRAPKYFCDFKFRSTTFNAGSVGADIKMKIFELDG